MNSRETNRIDQSMGDNPERMTEEERKKFNKGLQTFPLASRNFIADLSNIFIEEDAYKRIRGNPKDIEQIKETFTTQGLEGEHIGDILRFFNLPDSAADQK